MFPDDVHILDMAKVDLEYILRCYLFAVFLCVAACPVTAMDNNSVPTVNVARDNVLTFHERCGSLVKMTNGGRTAERQRPLDEFNNGVVMTARPLLNDERFEVSQWLCHMQYENVLP